MLNVDQRCMRCMEPLDADGLCPHCHFDMAAYRPKPHQLPARSILNGKYLVGCVLGEGGFGITYVGWDLVLDMMVAIKEYYPVGFVSRNHDLTGSVLPLGGDSEEFFAKGRARFLAEAQNLARFFANPGIVSVKDYFTENNTGYIVMEYIRGENLGAYIRRHGGRVELNPLLDMLATPMRSLEEVHAVGIIHRDISPQNLMVAENGYVKLIDFGASKILDDPNRSTELMLRPGYAPEEMYRTNGRLGPWTDVYELCATIYKAITGVTPPEATMRLRTDELVAPSKLGAALSPAQERALLKGLAVLAKDRYADMAELRASLVKEEAPRSAVRGWKRPLQGKERVTGREVKSAEVPIQQPAAARVDAPQTNAPDAPAANASAQFGRQGALHLGGKRPRLIALIAGAALLCVAVALLLWPKPRPSVPVIAGTSSAAPAITTDAPPIASPADAPTDAPADVPTTDAPTALPTDTPESTPADTPVQATAAPTADLDAEYPQFHDLSFYNMLWKAMGKTSGEYIHRDEMRAVTELTIAAGEVTFAFGTGNEFYAKGESWGKLSLRDLQYFPNLRKLYIADVKLSDTDVLDKLLSLRTIWLTNCEMPDCAPFADMPALTRLYLYDNQISDIGPLQGLYLVELGLSDNPVESLEPLRKMTTLRTLYIDGTAVTDLSPLSGLEALETLSARYTSITVWLPVKHVNEVLR